jgi:hypothetical protein
MSKEVMSKEVIETRFEELFGISYERGLERLRVLLRRSVNFQKFTGMINNMEISRISMSERDFGIFAFFACLGAGVVEELGISSLPETTEEIIDAEFVEGGMNEPSMGSGKDFEDP